MTCVDIPRISITWTTAGRLRIAKGDVEIVLEDDLEEIAFFHAAHRALMSEVFAGISPRAATGQ